MTKQVKKEHKMRTWTGGVMVGIASCVLTLTAATALNLYHPSALQPSANVAVAQSATDMESTIINAVNTAKDAVVSVQNYGTYLFDNQPNYNPFSYFSEYDQQQNEVDLVEPDSQQVLQGEGSGVIYKSENGQAYIVTNNHVVDGADSLQVRLSDGTEVEAELIGTDLLTDLAVLRIKADNVKTVVQFADSDAVQVGSIAIAIGSPLGSQYANSVTQGIISSAARLMSVDVDGDYHPDIQTVLLQTDAAINPGNSGGALINKNGELVGVNSSKLAHQAIEGMGFAIPSNEVRTIVAQLEKDGRVNRPVLGIRTEEVANLTDRSRVDVLKLPEDQRTGIVIDVQMGSSAQRAGLQKYDVITQVAGVTVTDVPTLRQELYKHNVGDTVEVTVLRNGEEVKVSVVLEAENAVPY